ncbi:hypothetical protein [Saccharothrix sp. ST-888]|uniref:hypothetical protein n=1 Tax=Saccharothrix sp. ST-888 TaxID=1427391 RepID=UPI0005EC97F7|nr:hypothetical protein [Saccharothrix sp. ST-888]
MTESTRPDAPAASSTGLSAEPTTDPAAEDVRKPRRTTALRWGAAALLLLLSGTATAVAVTAQPRTDMPGLRTASDGRYAFPPLTLPPLPSGRPAPGADPANRRHYADLRLLLLPVPKGASDASGASASASTTPSADTTSSASASPSASASASAPATSAPASVSAAGTMPAAGAAWAKCSDYADRFKSPATRTALLNENACRAATQRVWTAPDGTRTEIWLLSFGSEAEAGAFYRDLGTEQLKDVPALTDVHLPIDVGPGSRARLMSAGKTAGGAKDPVGRVAGLVNGDVFASVAMTNPRGVPVSAFQQVTILQANMLN